MKKIVLKLLTAALAAAFALGAFSGCTARKDKLVIRNWGEYMDPEIYRGFEDWYKSETGKKIKVDYKEYNISEDAYLDVSVRKADYDLVCPSDYVAERFIKNGYAQKINTEIFDNKEKDLFYDGLLDNIEIFDKNLEYFTPYAWGTMGIMYDTTAIKDADVSDMETWETLWSEKYSGKILMKDSPRDSYSIAMIYQKRAQLSEASSGYTDYGSDYSALLNGIFEQATEQTLADAKTVLLAQKPLVTKYEVDDGKQEMLSGSTAAKLGLFWSCDAGLIMQEEGGEKFMYTVPKEGSNVWFDGWIIPSTAKNAEAANYFLKYLCDPEVAKQNLDWMGCSMSVKSAMTAAKAELEADPYEGYPEGFKEMYLSLMFPSEDILGRCKIMRDFGEEMSAKLDEMWVDVRAA